MHIRLKDFRDENKIQQAELAEVIGVTQSTISRNEALGRELTKKQFERLCERYGEELVMKYVMHEGDKEEQEAPMSSLAEFIKGKNDANRILTDVLLKQQKTIEAQALLLAEMMDMLKRDLAEIKEKLK